MPKKFKSKGQRFDDVESQIQKIKEETPKSGDYLYDYRIDSIKQDMEKLSREEIKKKYKLYFSDLPISSKTIKGLQKRGFNKMTEIQRCTLPHAVSGRDILGASKTGSGKTLCYLIPVIERLYINRWTPLDGLGALIILPTRELAVQVFEVMNSITTFHELSLGLIIGGKNVKAEKERISQMNILICTPGRLLQHLEETADFRADNLQILVIDEADAILELGFVDALRAILSYIPKERQTILFSATLSKGIRDLAKLSLKQPENIFLHEAHNINKESTDLTNMYEIPVKLKQYYMFVNLHDKIDTLFSFLKSHKHNKIIVFFSTCKQVRFCYEAFKKLRIGSSLFELHGRQKEPKRMAIFFTFSEKKHAILFTTNIAARGLDFPSVQWVVQVDCADDVETYIHRAGRTARYTNDGKALLLLSPSEEKFVEKLKKRNIQLHRIQANPDKALTIQQSLQSFVTENIDLKYLAQRAFISYVRSIFLMKDKDVFDVNQLNCEAYALSMGLIQAPNIKIKTQEVNQEDLDDEESEEENQIKQEENQLKEEQEMNEDQNNLKKKSKLDKLKQKIKTLKEQKKNQNELIKQNEEDIQQKLNKHDVNNLKQRYRTNEAQEKFEKMIEDNEEEIVDDLFVVKKKDNNNNLLGKRNDITLNYISNKKLKKIKDDGIWGGKNKILFDEQGNKYTTDQIREKGLKENLAKAEDDDINLFKHYISKLERNRGLDKERESERIKRKRLKQKYKQTEDEEDESRQVVLGSHDNYAEDDDYDEAPQLISANQKEHEDYDHEDE